jgi:RHS repeat-associated protein
MWGTDLSGSMQGAGGVGGLLAENIVSNGVHFVAYDANGNVADLVSATNGTVTATYEYGPFGEVIRATGPMAKLNPLRFSTKYQDDETGFLYYLYRYYIPSTGRWPSRDPLGEPGFEVLTKRPISPSSGDPNMYLFVRNNPNGFIDSDGLAVIAIPIGVGVGAGAGTGAGAGAGAGILGGLGAGAGIGAAGVCGWEAGTWICDNTSAGELGDVIGDWISPRCRVGAWQCHASCNVQAISAGQFPDRVTGNATGSNEADACRAAKRSAIQNAPLGSYARHCRCTCVKLR